MYRNASSAFNITLDGNIIYQVTITIQWLGDRGFIFLDSVMPVENQVAQCQVIE
jgi:hypothetical protein